MSLRTLLVHAWSAIPPRYRMPTVVATGNWVTATATLLSIVPVTGATVSETSSFSTPPVAAISPFLVTSTADQPTSLGPVIGPLQHVCKVTAAAVAQVLTGGDPQAALTAAAQAADDLISNYALANGG